MAEFVLGLAIGLSVLFLVVIYVGVNYTRATANPYKDGTWVAPGNGYGRYGAAGSKEYK